MNELLTAAMGMVGAKQDIGIHTNNIAAGNVYGYKRKFGLFVELKPQSVQPPGTPTADGTSIAPSGIQLGMGSRLASVATILEQGALERTDNPYNIALEGQSYIQVNMPDGTKAYTRDGSLAVSAEGKIVTQLGYSIVPDVTIPANTVSLDINEYGVILAKIQGQEAPQEIGKFELANFPNPGGLEGIGNNLLLATDASGQATTGTAGTQGFARVYQGFLEASNVNTITELTSLIEGQYQFGLCSKAVEIIEKTRESTMRI